MHVQNFSPKCYQKKKKRCSLSSCTHNSSHSLQLHSFQKLEFLLKERIRSLWEQILYFMRSLLLHSILSDVPKCWQFYYALAYCVYYGLHLCTYRRYISVYYCVIECVIKVD